MIPLKRILLVLWYGILALALVSAITVWLQTLGMLNEADIATKESPVTSEQLVESAKKVEVDKEVVNKETDQTYKDLLKALSESKEALKDEDQRNLQTLEPQDSDGSDSHRLGPVYETFAMLEATHCATVLARTQWLGGSHEYLYSIAWQR